MDNRVAIVKCSEYSQVKKSIKKALEPLGGMEKFVHPNDKVVIKPNFVSKKKPEDAATTHPDFLRAVAELALEAGGKVKIAESPGGPYNKAVLQNIYSGCMADKATEGLDAELNFDTEFSDVYFAGGKTIKSFNIINPILEADVIISLPKLKTHAMTSYTGAVKNLFGTIPGTHKAEMHFRLDDRDAFCSMLVDLYECVKPHLSIMDAVWGMEGDGPTSGINRHIGLILAAENAHALDMAACTIIDYTPQEVPTVREAISRSLVCENPSELTLLGDFDTLPVIKDFKKPQSHFNLLKLLNLPEGLNDKLKNALASRPKVNYSQCIGCGVCARDCPAKTISMDTKKPVIGYEKCIKCFCCQELCPKGAIKIHRPLLNRFMIKFLK